jgi:hypothetical protein
MTSPAVGKFGQLIHIVTSAFTVAFQAPAHVHDLGIFGDFDSRHIAVTTLTVQACGNVRPVRKMDKIRHLGDRHPGNILVIENVIFEDGKPGTGIRFGDLLVAAPALGQGRQPG